MKWSMRWPPTSAPVSWPAGSGERQSERCVNAAVSWRQLWNDTAALSGRAEARWLCEEASGSFGAEFADVLDTPASIRSVAHLDAMLAQQRNRMFCDQLRFWSRDENALVDQ